MADGEHPFRFRGRVERDPGKKSGSNVLRASFLIEEANHDAAIFACGLRLFSNLECSEREAQDVQT